MKQTLFTLMPLLVVPLILLALLVFAIVIVRRVKDNEAKMSARAGLGAGLVLFVIYMVSRLSEAGEANLEFANFPEIDFAPLAVGALIGFGLLWSVKRVLPTRYVGISTLLLSAVGTSALYSFIFIEDMRVGVMYAALGGVLGMLMYLMLFPMSTRSLWDSTPASKSTPSVKASKMISSRMSEAARSEPARSNMLWEPARESAAPAQSESSPFDDLGSFN